VNCSYLTIIKHENRSKSILNLIESCIKIVIIVYTFLMSTEVNKLHFKLKNGNFDQLYNIGFEGISHPWAIVTFGCVKV